MYKLDEQEKEIIRELIRNPRISDNQIAARTKVPLKTINRKRKILEEKNLISYFTYFNNSSEGTQAFNGRSLFIIILKEGITRKSIQDNFGTSEKSYRFFSKHLFNVQIGDYEGNAALIIQMESIKSDDLVEIYNAEIVPELESFFGHGCVKKTITIPVVSNLRLIRNYLPNTNMVNGKIRDDWPNENIYVDD